MNNPQRTSPRLSLSSSSPKILSASTSREFSFSDGIINDEHIQTSFIPESTSHSFQNNSNSNSATDSGVVNSTIVNLSFHVHKLDLLYQSLEGRVQKLESFVTDHIILNDNANHHHPMQGKRTFSFSDSVINEHPINSNVNLNNGSPSINNNNMSNLISNSNLLNLSNLSSFLQLDSIQKDEISVIYIIIIICVYLHLFRKGTWMIIVYHFYRRKRHLLSGN